MELNVLQVLSGFGVGVIVGVVAVLLFNKIKSGSASASGVKQEFDDYKNDVEAHFEETSKKFHTMTEQYQDLYQHLSVGATSLCRPDSVAAALVDDSDPAKPAQLEMDKANANEPASSEEPSAGKEPSADKDSSSDPEPAASKEPLVEQTSSVDKQAPSVDDAVDQIASSDKTAAEAPTKS